MLKLRHSSGAKLSEVQIARLESLRSESFSDIGDNRFVLLLFGLMATTTSASVTLISLKIESFIPAIILATVTAIALTLFLYDPRKHQQISSDIFSLGFMAFFLLVTIQHGRVDLVMLWFFTHIIWVAYTGNITKGLLTIIYFMVLLYCGLFIVSPDIQITRDLDFFIINANPAILFIGFMLPSEMRIENSLIQLMKQRDTSKMKTDRLDLILKHTGMGILDVSQSQIVEFTNDMGRSLLGYPNDIEGKQFIGLANFKNKDGKILFAADNEVSNAIRNKSDLKDYRVYIVESKTTADIDVITVDQSGSVIIIKPITLEGIKTKTKIPANPQANLEEQTSTTKETRQAA